VEVIFVVSLDLQVEWRVLSFDQGCVFGYTATFAVVLRIGILLELDIEIL
jgi:hypothetical protein